MNPKKLGCCTVCDKEIYEISLRYTQPPLERFPRKLGIPKEDAWKVEFILRDGSTMSLSFCEACKNNLTTGQFPSLWNRVLESWVFEMRDDVRKVLPVKPLTPTQKESMQKWFETQVGNGMLGILASVPLKDIHA